MNSLFSVTLLSLSVSATATLDTHDKKQVNAPSNDACPTFGCVVFGFGFSCDGSSGWADCSGCPCCIDGSCRDRRLSVEEKRHLERTFLDPEPESDEEKRHLERTFLDPEPESGKKILSSLSFFDRKKSTAATEAYKADRHLTDECPTFGCVVSPLADFSCDGSGMADCSRCPCCKDGSCTDRRLSDEEKKQLGEHLDVDEKVLIPLRILSNANVPQLDLSSSHLFKERILSNLTLSTASTDEIIPLII